MVETSSHQLQENWLIAFLTHLREHDDDAPLTNILLPSTPHLVRFTKCSFGQTLPFLVIIFAEKNFQFSLVCRHIMRHVIYTRQIQSWLLRCYYSNCFLPSFETIDHAIFSSWPLTVIDQFQLSMGEQFFPLLLRLCKGKIKLGKRLLFSRTKLHKHGKSETIYIKRD